MVGLGKVSYRYIFPDRNLDLLRRWLEMIVENDYFRIALRKQDGAINSLFIKKTGCELIGETRLASAFRLCAPIEGYQCNYIESFEQKNTEVTMDGAGVKVTQKGMCNSKGALDIDLTYTICSFYRTATGTGRRSAGNIREWTAYSGR